MADPYFISTDNAGQLTPELRDLLAAQLGGVASWDDLADKPTAFPPSAHNHDDRYFTEAEVDAKIAAAPSRSGSMSNPIDLGTDHLDTIITPDHYTQIYTSRATVAQGYPFENKAGVLEVLAWHSEGIIQRWTSQAGGIATRYMLRGKWQLWQTPAEIDARLAAIEFDTGWRSVVGLIPEDIYVGGDFWVRREGRRVWFHFEDLDLADDPTSGAVSPGIILPVGFRPTPRYTYLAFAQRNNNYSPGPMRVNMYGGMDFYFHEDGKLFTGDVSYLTDDAPPTETLGDPA